MSIWTSEWDVEISQTEFIIANYPGKQIMKHMKPSRASEPGDNAEEDFGGNLESSKGTEATCFRYALPSRVGDLVAQDNRTSVHYRKE